MLHSRCRIVLLCLFIALASAAGCDKSSSLDSFQERQGKGISLTRNLAGQINAIRFESTPLTDADLTLLGSATTLRELAGNAAQVTSTGLIALQGCSSLQSLQLNSCRLSEQAAQSIGSLKTLTTLNLTDAQELTPACLACLSELQKLVELGLSGTAIDDACIPHLPAAPVRSLALSRTRLTSAGILSLVDRFPDLEVIQLDEVALDAAATAALSRLERLTDVSLSSCRLDDAAAAPLGTLKQLRVLNLSHNTALTDSLIGSLGNAAELRTLNVSGTQFSGVAFAEAGFPSLAALIADDTQVKGESLRSLKLPTLFSLSLNGCPLSLAEIRRVFAENDQTAISFEESAPAIEPGNKDRSDRKVKGQI
ncbi:MAG: hypothetical protein ACKO2P_20945 [Planctomycetota bacterium]